MDRRDFIAAVGTAGIGGLAGCSGTLPGSRFFRNGPPAGCGVPDSFAATRGDLPKDETPTDGIPPAVPGNPSSRNVDTASFDTTSVKGETVPLVPVDVAHYWWLRGAARFADARPPALYDRSHVYGAVESPAPGVRYNGCDPATYWPKEDRVVCYCGCPHHLSSLRASKLISNGYSEVYAIDEGFWAWHRRGYPVAGNRPEWTPTKKYFVHGHTDPRYANESAWITVPSTGESEATGIGADGNYTLDPKFSNVTAETPVVVKTPGYRVHTTLGNATTGVITGNASAGGGAGASGNASANGTATGGNTSG